MTLAPGVAPMKNAHEAIALTAHLLAGPHCATYLIQVVMYIFQIVLIKRHEVIIISFF